MTSPLTSTTTSTDESSAGESSGGDGCGPSEDFDAYVWVDNGGPPGSFTLACSIVGVVHEDVMTEVELDCDGVTRRLSIWSPQPPLLPDTGDVVLDVVFTSGGFSLQSVVKLVSSTGELLLAASNSTLFPGDGTVPADFFAPLSTTLDPDACEVQAAFGGGGFVNCPLPLRRTIQFSLDGDSVDVLDRNRADLGGDYEVALEAAELALVDEVCVGPEHWYRWVVYRPMSESGPPGP